MKNTFVEFPRGLGRSLAFLISQRTSVDGCIASEGYVYMVSPL